MTALNTPQLITSTESTQNSPLDALTGSKLLMRNTVWSVIGLGAPLAVGVLTVPSLIRGLGPDRFGILSFAWLIVGYLGLFDLGIGRALTQLIAKKQGTAEQRDIPVLARTALFLMAMLGVLGAVILAGFTPWLVRKFLTMPVFIRRETVNSFYLLAVSLPLVLLTAGLRGMLQARQRFDITNAIAIPLGILNFLAPWIVLLFTSNLAYVIGILVINKFISLLAHLWPCVRVFPGLLGFSGPEKGMIKSLLSLGGWMTASNVIGPLTMYIDRPVIGKILSVAAVTYYAVPFEMANKLLILSGAVGGVMFPAFSTSFGRDPKAAAQLYVRWLKYLFIVLYPACLVVFTCARPGLSLWLGADFAFKSFRVLQILAVGVFVLGIEGIPFALIQGIGRPDLPALLNLIEMPFYFAAIWWLTKTYGINGAALAWALRASVDALALMLIARRLLPTISYSVSRVKGAVILASVVAVISTLTLPFRSAVWVLAGALAVHAWVAWSYLFRSAERPLRA